MRKGICAILIFNSCVTNKKYQEMILLRGDLKVSCDKTQGVLNG